MGKEESRNPIRLRFHGKSDGQEEPTLEDDADASMVRDSGCKNRRSGHQLGHVSPLTACANHRELSLQDLLLEGIVSRVVVNVSHCNRRANFKLLNF